MIELGISLVWSIFFFAGSTNLAVGASRWENLLPTGGVRGHFSSSPLLLWA